MTHSKLLDVAIIAFAKNGLDGASTRQIAKAAGTAMSAITYHYGGKEQLYLAAADRIAEEIAEAMIPVFETESEDADTNPASARASIHRILSKLADRVLSDHKKHYSQFLLREQFNPTEAFDHMYTRFMGVMMERLVRHVMTVTGARRNQAALAAITLLGQTLAPRYSQASMARLMGQPRLNDATMTGFRAQLTNNIDAVLDRMAVDGNL